MNYTHSRSIAFVLTLAALCAPACNSKDVDTTVEPPAPAVPETYDFDSRFEPGTSAISHSGQSMRHALIGSMMAYIDGMTDAIDGDTFNPTDADTVVAALQYYYTFDDQTSGGDAHGVSTSPDPLQVVFDDISSGKDLHSKMAGNDAATDHRDWSSEFVGWSDATIAQSGGGIDSPEQLVQAFFHTLGALAFDRENGTIPVEPGSMTPIANVYVTADGRDLRQLLQKFLLMGVSYSQGTDDYLDDDVADKGILAPNTRDEDKPYSVLGHHWDEAFGYFGAARDYARYTDDELAEEDGRADWQGHHDSDGDGAIDLTKEINWGASVNAAKRDRGAVDATDYTADVYNAFIAGRHLISNAGDTLTAAELDTLRSHATVAKLGWELAVVATVVHYINEVVVDTEAMGSDDYAFLNHAKHWSEMKGFALGLQFNPKMALSVDDFAQLHQLMGDAPVLATADETARAAYVTDLMAARDLLQNAYGLSQGNVEAW